jgi:Holliday junction resolvase
MNAAKKGRRAEHRCQRLLESAGFATVRAAGSKGPADIVAFDGVSIRLISVKSGTRYPSAAERDTLRALVVPPNTSKEIWRFPDRKAPVIERLS